MKLHHILGLGVVVAAMWPRAAGRGSYRPRRRPDAGEAGAPITSPREPTLSGGAAAPLDA